MKIAVTGGIAEGKSTVLGYIAASGLPVASADAIAHEVFDQADTQEAIGQLLRLPVPLDRALVRSKIQTDPQLRRTLNALTHPKILRALKNSPAIFFEVPLLIESCLIGEFDRIWVATCGPEEQIRRLAFRLGNEPEARKMIGLQLPTTVKIAFADEIVRTNAPEDAVKHFVQAAVAREIRV